MEEYNWLYHVEHLAGGLAYQNECRVCRLRRAKGTGILNRKEMVNDMNFYADAVKSGRKSITIEEKNQIVVKSYGRIR